MIVYFDIDETLLDQSHAELSAAGHFLDVYGSQLGREYTAAELSQHWRLLRERHSEPYFQGAIGFQERRRRRMRELFPDGTSLSDAEADARFQVFFTHYRGNWRLFPDVLPCLRRMRRVRLGVVSNGNRAQQIEKLERTGILGRFEAIVTSEQCGRAKPDTGLFHAACEAAEVNPAAAVYVGDRVENDARAACQAGLRGIWLNRRGGAAVEDVETVFGLQQLCELLAVSPGRRRRSEVGS